MAEAEEPRTTDDQLLEFIHDLTEEDFVKVEEDLGEGFVRLNVSEAERRQAKHDIRCLEDAVVEMLRNCRDAGSSRIFLALVKGKDDKRSITIIDDGCGIPASLHKRIFEPRVTSKLEAIVEDEYGVHGRGLALYSVKLAAEEALVVSSLPARGTIVKIRADSQHLPEKKDQSTPPVLGFRQGQPHIVRGPHNILRLALEFNIAHPNLEIYIGSPTDVLATMRYVSLASMAVAQDYEAEKHGLAAVLGGQTGVMSFKEAVEKSPWKLWQCVGVIDDATVLSRVAGDLYGLSISQRNGYRVINEEIEPLRPLTALFEGKAAHQWAKTAPELASRREGVYNVSRYISDADLQELALAVAAQAKRMGERYFLNLDGLPKIVRNKNQLKITVDLSPERSD